MDLPAKILRAELSLLKSISSEKPQLEGTRRLQEQVGRLMEAVHKKEVIVDNETFENFQGAWISPKKQVKNGVILYLHGGGYCFGDFEYSKGFAGVLAAKCSMRVFTAAYRLAPEHPFPAALEDAVEAYSHLLRSGFTGSNIILCGESAGGGLIFSLCLKLRQLDMELPAGIISISPWVDLTQSGKSYEYNKDNDPHMQKKHLNAYADWYTDNKEDPLVSPLFGKLEGMPPSLIFAGEDEIMLEDAKRMSNKLSASGSQSALHIAPHGWHAYLLYSLKEFQQDFDRINYFIDSRIAQKNELMWMALDNAAKIYPAALNRNWSNVFRMSVTLTEEVDREVLSSALTVTMRRFPSIAVRLRLGAFWFYFEQLDETPEIQEEYSYPLRRMPFSQIRKCAFRVIAYENRIAVEYFHSVTDGTGGLIFLKTLTAEYLTQKYGACIPPEKGVWDRHELPKPEETEDSFLKNSGEVAMSRKEDTAYHIKGTPTGSDRLRLTTLKIDTSEIVKAAKSRNISVTAFLGAVMTLAILRIQKREVHSLKRMKPVKVLLPVNLRPIFGSNTMRNFASYISPVADQRMGEYEFEELCRLVYHSMGLDITKKNMRAKITTNVKDERSIFIKLTPLFIKNLILKIVFNLVGEKKSCLSLSNLGNVTVPEEMDKYVERFDFILGVQAKAPYNCGVLSYKNVTYINFIRNIKEPKLEYEFYKVLRELGVKAKAESNQPS